MMQNLHAQLCLGSLGDPIINTTFGQGTNPGPALTAATTAYQYVTSDCPQDGFYTVRNNTNSCFGNTWYTLNADHTGNPSGYFMLVNASFQPSAFYLDTVRGLCSNSTYEFAAWVMNVILPSSCGGSTIEPNLTFRIEKTDGSVLQTYNTGSIPPVASPVWKQYGSFFTTPPGVTDIVLRIVNNAQGGCGNDLALDDITFRPCGPQISGSIDGVPGNDYSLCEGETGSFVLNCTLSAGFNTPVFQWQGWNAVSGTWIDLPLATSTTLNFTYAMPAVAGIQQVRLAVAESGNMGSAQCRIYSRVFTFTVHAKPVTAALNDGPVCENGTLTLTATGGTQYAWSGPAGFSESGSPVLVENIQPAQAGKYVVLVTNAEGCSKKDSTNVSILPAPIATSAFTNAVICAKDSVQLIAGGGQTYLWIPSTGLSDPGVFNPKASPDTLTEYEVIVTNSTGCTDTAYATITVKRKPVADAGPDRVILEGQSIQLTGSISEPGNSFSWSPPLYMNDIYSLQPIVTPREDIQYILNVTSDIGCGTDADSMFVKVYRNVFVPSAFSPNGDGRNDTWNIRALAAFPLFEVTVYNRWGQLVYQAKNNLPSWDGTLNGKPLPVGAYIYYINLGNSMDTFKGTVMIIR